MLFGKCNLIVGLTTTRNEMLRISVPALAKLNERFLLVVHNDDATARLCPRDIRRLGYRGPLRIINSPTPVGVLRGRMRILARGRAVMPRADWVMFINADDVVIDVAVPNVGPANFAVIQNALLCRGRVADLMRGRDCVDGIDGTNIVLQRPNVSVVGALLRADVVRGAFAHIDGILPQIDAIDSELDYAPPTDVMMWSLIGMYAHHVRPDDTAIFMDRINYIKNDLDVASGDGRPRRPAGASGRHARVIARYCALMRRALGAAPAGQ